MSRLQARLSVYITRVSSGPQHHPASDRSGESSIQRHHHLRVRRWGGDFDTRRDSYSPSSLIYHSICAPRLTGHNQADTVSQQPIPLLNRHAIEPTPFLYLAQTRSNPQTVCPSLRRSFPLLTSRYHANHLPTQFYTFV